MTIQASLFNRTVGLPRFARNDGLFSVSIQRQFIR